MSLSKEITESNISIIKNQSQGILQICKDTKTDSHQYTMHTLE